MEQAKIEELKSQLAQRAVTVTFKRKDGELRVMECTLNMQLVPPSKWPQNKVTLSENTKQTTMRVYDLKAKDWRSFVIDNVIKTV